MPEWWRTECPQYDFAYMSYLEKSVQVQIQLPSYNMHVTGHRSWHDRDDHHCWLGPSHVAYNYGHGMQIYLPSANYTGILISTSDCLPRDFAQTSHSLCPVWCTSRLRSSPIQQGKRMGRNAHCTSWRNVDLLAKITDVDHVSQAQLDSSWSLHFTKVKAQACSSYCWCGRKAGKQYWRLSVIYAFRHRQNCTWSPSTIYYMSKFYLLMHVPTKFVQVMLRERHNVMLLHHTRRFMYREKVSYVRCFVTKPSRRLLKHLFPQSPAVQSRWHNAKMAADRYETYVKLPSLSLWWRGLPTCQQGGQSALLVKAQGCYPLRAPSFFWYGPRMQP